MALRADRERRVLVRLPETYGLLAEEIRPGNQQEEGLQAMQGTTAVEATAKDKA